MSEEDFNMSLRKFLKQVGVTSQREIENAARAMASDGKTHLEVKMVLTGKDSDLNHVVEGKIELP